MSDIMTYSDETFESIKHINEYGQEFWYARELQTALEYSEWRNFKKIIDKAIEELTAITGQKAVATLYGSGNGTVIVPSSTIQFFSEEIGKVCVFNNGENTKYIIKNTRNESQNIIITFIE